MGKRPDGLGHERKLSDADIDEIRRLNGLACECCGKKRWTYRELADKYGVTAALICNVVRNKKYFREK